MSYGGKKTLFLSTAFRLKWYSLFLFFFFFFFLGGGKNGEKMSYKKWVFPIVDPN
jgi:hypothetical protein